MPFGLLLICGFIFTAGILFWGIYQFDRDQSVYLRPRFDRDITPRVIHRRRRP